MKHLHRKVAVIFMITALFFGKLSAQTLLDVPRWISYQGQVTTQTGAALNGSHHITATLYSDPQGKNSVWQGSYDADITSGTFTIALGSGFHKLPEPSILSRPLWVGINIDNGEEMQPLTQLAAAPYALNVPDQSITMAKLAPDVILGAGRRNPTPQGVPDRVALSDAGGTTFGAGTQGTTTTVLHGNAGGSPTYGAVILTADVSGILPIAKGGTNSTAGAWLLNGNSLASDTWIGTTDDSTVEVHIFDSDQPAHPTHGTGRVMRWQYTANPGPSVSPVIIGGHHENRIASTAFTDGSVITGGGTDASINDIRGAFDFIGGGKANVIDTATLQSSILCGEGHTIGKGGFGNAILGGDNNTINSTMDYATILPGTYLTAQSWFQTVMGRYNTALGNETSAANNGSPLLIIGNGTATNARSNAFVVIDNGTSVVTHTNGTGATTSAPTGGRCVDNTIAAWAYCTVAGGAVTVVADYGVTSVAWNAAGNYTATLNIQSSFFSGTNGHNAAAVVTPISANNVPICVSTSASSIGTVGGVSKFSIYIADVNCAGVDKDFMFMVIGRP